MAAESQPDLPLGIKIILAESQANLIPQRNAVGSEQNLLTQHRCLMWLKYWRLTTQTHKPASEKGIKKVWLSQVYSKYNYWKILWALVNQCIKMLFAELKCKNLRCSFNKFQVWFGPGGETWQSATPVKDLSFGSSSSACDFLSVSEKEYSITKVAQHTSLLFESE